MASASALALTALAPSVSAQTAPPTTSNDKSASTVKEVVVTGQRAALRSAQQIKKNAEQIVDSITATDIGALPDRSVTEALQRVPGLTITRTQEPRDVDRLSVEGSGVQIRGLSYVRSELNGRDSFSAKGGRALSFDDLPPEMFAGVDVYKNPSADMIEGQIGGTINLRTRLPFDQPGRLIAFSADANYGDKIDKWTPAGSVLVSDRWHTGIGEFGLLADISDSNFASVTDTLSVNNYYARATSQAYVTPNAVYIPGAPTKFNYVFVPGGFGYRRLDFERERQGFDVAGQWRPTPDLLITAQFIRSAAYQDENENAVGNDPGQGVNPAPGATFTYDSRGLFTSGNFVSSQGGASSNPDLIDDRFNNTHTVTSDYSVNLNWKPNRKWDLQADVQYIDSSRKATDFTIFDQPYGPTHKWAIPYSTMNLTGSLPYMNFAASPADVKDKSNYFWDAAMDYHSHNTGEEWAERADATYTFDSDWLKTFRFGVRHSRKDVVTRESIYNWAEITYSWAGGGVALLDGSNVTAGANPVVNPGVTNSIPSSMPNFSNFFDGQANLPGVFPAGEKAFLKNWAGAVSAIVAAENRPGGNCCGWSPFAGDFSQGSNAINGVNTQKEEDWAGYGLLRFGHDLPILGMTVPMDGNLGLRIADTRAAGYGAGTVSGPPSQGCSPGNMTLPASDCSYLNGGGGLVNRGGSNSVMVLPSLNLRFKFTPNFFVRMAAGKDMVRPTFAQMQPSISIGGTAGIIGSNGTCIANTPPPSNNCVIIKANEGNPALKSTRSNSYDLSFEWYFAKEGSLTADLFYKDVYDFISATTVNEPFANSNGQTATVSVTTPYNAGHGVIKGFELAYQQYYDFLPGVLKGLGTEANFTYIDSRGTVNAPESPYDNGQIAADKLSLPLEGLSRSAYNLAGLYDYGPVSLRLAWNWRDKYLLTADSVDGFPAWTEAYGQLDASGFYKINSHLKVGIQAANLTNSTYRVGFSYVPHADGTPIPPGILGHNWVNADRRVSIVLRGVF